MRGTLSRQFANAVRTKIKMQRNEAAQRLKSEMEGVEFNQNLQSQDEGRGRTQILDRKQRPVEQSLVNHQGPTSRKAPTKLSLISCNFLRTDDSYSQEWKAAEFKWNDQGLREDFIIPSRVREFERQDQNRKELVKDSLRQEQKLESRPISYFEGHSLGLQPKSTSQKVMKFMDEWAQNGVESWFKHGWLEADLKLSELMAPLLGSQPEEITFTSGLTENIHKLVSTFYRPQGRRNKIITIENEFPSDLYAIGSQINLKGLDERQCMLQVKVNQYDAVEATDQIIEAIEKNKETTCILWFSIVNYLTSVRYDVEKIAKVCHKYGIYCMVDLAHAAGSIPLDLHKWRVDGAVWCSYKYLNSGPGCLGGIFVHETHSHLPPGMRGWHGNSRATQFQMRPEYEPEADARRFQISNYDPGQSARVEAGLELFHKAGGMERVRARNVELTDYFVDQVQDMPRLKILSPIKESERGSHVSIMIEDADMKYFKQLMAEEGVLGDLRRFEDRSLRPQRFSQEDSNSTSSGSEGESTSSYLMRISPIGLYNTKHDIDRLIQVLNLLLTDQKTLQRPLIADDMPSTKSRKAEFLSGIVS